MLARKEDGGKVSLKMGFLIPKTLRMKILELRLFSKIKKNDEMAEGHMAQRWPCKGDQTVRSMYVGQGCNCLLVHITLSP